MTIVPMMSDYKLSTVPTCEEKCILLGVHSVWDVYALKALHSSVKREEGKEYL